MPQPADRPLLEAMTNLAAFHRDHEKFYATAPREQAVALQRHARTLLALADRWTSTTASERDPFSPYEGAPDLNADAAIALEGVLFLEGAAEPPELADLTRRLRDDAERAISTGTWLGQAMEASWGVTAALLGIDELADQVGERHRIIANDMQAAGMSVVSGKLLDRAVDVLDTIDFTPAALRADIGGPGVAARRLYAAAELIARAADLASESAGLVAENERRWRIFRSRVVEVLGRDV